MIDPYEENRPRQIACRQQYDDGWDPADPLIHNSNFWLGIAWGLSITALLGISVWTVIAWFVP